MDKRLLREVVDKEELLLAIARADAKVFSMICRFVSWMLCLDRVASCRLSIIKICSCIVEAGS